MNIRHLFTLVTVALTVQASADNYRDMKPLTLEIPEMKAALVEIKNLPPSTMNLTITADKWKPDFDFFMDARPLVSGEPLKTNNIKVKK